MVLDQRLVFTNVEASHTTVAKVADKNTEVLGRLFKAGMMKVEWQICEVPVGNFKFYRKPYYNDFDTNFTFDQKPIPELVPWNDNYDASICRITCINRRLQLLIRKLTRFLTHKICRITFKK